MWRRDTHINENILTSVLGETNKYFRNIHTHREVPLDFRRDQWSRRLASPLSTSNWTYWQRYSFEARRGLLVPTIKFLKTRQISRPNYSSRRSILHLNETKKNTCRASRQKAKNEQKTPVNERLHAAVLRQTENEMKGLPYAPDTACDRKLDRWRCAGDLGSKWNGINYMK